METTTRTINFRKQVEQVVKGYETDPAKGLVHGCAKDWIQNGWGHRSNKKKGTGWSFKIELINNDKGNFLVLEDSGATGLIGKNYTQTEINTMMDNGVELLADEKLARFCSLYNSGGNNDSAGLFGRGKLMYQAASDELSYYFDSYTSESNYVANKLVGNEILVQCYEGDEAKKYILEETGLDEKTSSGTRVIIVNPKKEIVDQLIDGRLIFGINETWWKIIQKYNADIKILKNGEVLYTAVVPDVYEKYYTDKNKSHIFENVKYKEDLIIKKIGFILVDDETELDEDLANVSYYRKNMKIGDVYPDIASLPIEDEYKKRISGFIEVNENWENLLNKNENLEHYGPVSKRTREIQGLKTILNSKLDEFAILQGIKKKNTHKKPNEELEKMANDFTDFLLDNDINLDFKPATKYKKSKLLEVALIKKYPNPGKRTLEYNQGITFSYILANNSTKDDIIVETSIIGDNDKRVVLKEEIKANKSFESDEISFKFKEFYQKQRNIIYVKAYVKDEQKISDYSSFPIYVDIDDEPTIEDIEFKLVGFEWPTDGSRSVYYNEEIKNIRLQINNNLNSEITLALSCLVQDSQDRNNTIDNFCRINPIELKEFESKVIEVGDLLFDDKYLDRKGNFVVRFNLSHLSGLEDKRKGEKINSIGVSMLYEEEQVDTSLNLFNVNTVALDNNYEKSILSGNQTGSYTLSFNLNYVMHKSIFDEGENSLIYKMYILEEMCKAIVNIKLENLDYSILNCTQEDFDHSLSAQDILVKINNTVDKLLGLYFEMRG